MKSFSSKPAPRTIWCFSLVALVVSALLVFAVPWQRLKVPALILCLNHGNGYMRGTVAKYLGRIDDGDPKVLVSALLPNLKDKNVYVREMTAISLGHIHQYPEQVVPALLTYIDTETQWETEGLWAVYAIGTFGTNARPWSPILVQMIETNRFNYWSGNARAALYKIDPETGKLLIDKYNTEVSNRVAKAELENAEKQRRKALAATNPPSAKPLP